MRVLRSTSATFLLLCPLTALCGDSPAHSVERFYDWAIRPSAADIGSGLTPVRRLLGKELLAALEAQGKYEAACARLVPEDVKPYMLDMSPFFYWPDGAKSLESSRTTVHGDRARVFVQLAYDDVRWTDVVVLRRVEAQWVIVDIQWQDGGSLTKRLTDFASHRCAP